MEKDRQLPDEELHDLAKKLAQQWEEITVTFTKAYAIIETNAIHESVKKKMIGDGI